MKRTRKLILIGAGEFARVARECFERDTDYRVAAFAAEKKLITDRRVDGLEVVALEELTRRFKVSAHAFFTAVTFTDLNRARRRLHERVRAMGYAPAGYAHPSAAVSRSAKVGHGCFIHAQSAIEPFAALGDCVIVGGGAQIAHRAEIASGAFLASAAVVGGYSRIGENAFLGLNSTVVDGITVGREAFIAAGALVTESAKAGRVYRGSPATDAGVPSLDYVRMKTAV